jgi:ribosomal RNA-processing protein 1
LRLDKYLFLIRCYVGVAFEIYLKGKINDKSGDAQEEEKEEDEGNKKRKRKGEEKSKNGKRRKQSTNNDEDAKTPGSEQQDGKWTELESYISFLEEGPLCPINFDPKEKKPAKNELAMPHGPDGLRYHITDIWLDELEKVVSSYDSEKREEEKPVKDRLDLPIELLLRPFEKLKKESQTKSVRTKVVSEVLDDERLVEWGFRERKKKRSSGSGDEDEEEEDDENDEWDGFDD